MSEECAIEHKLSLIESSSFAFSFPSSYFFHLKSSDKIVLLIYEDDLCSLKQIQLVMERYR